MYKVNLLAPELQRDISIDLRKLVKRMTVSVAVITLLAGYSAFLYSFYSTKKEIAKTEKYLNELELTVKKVEEIKKQRQNNEQSVQKFKDLLSKRLTWSYLLEDLNYNLPVDVWLESVDLSFTDPQVTTGTAGQAPGQPGAQAPPVQAKQAQAPQAQQAQAGPKPAPNTLNLEGYSRTVPSVGVLINNLNELPYFTRATLIEIAEDKKNVAFKFKVTAVVKEGGGR